MSASTAYAVPPRSAAGVQEDLRALKASLPQGPHALPPAFGSFGGQALPPGVHRGRTVIEPVRRLPSQLDVIDDLLDGGLPRGRVSELIGLHSSGKTSLLISFLAAATRRGEVTAYVDLADSLHPPSFAAAGVDLERLLWVRPPSLRDAARCTEIILQAGGFAAVALDLSDRLSRSVGQSSPKRPNGERSRRKTPSAALWPRLARAAERSHAALIVLAPQRLTGSVATLGVETRAQKTLWRSGLWPLFDGFDVSVTVARSKLGPPGRSSWLVARHSSLVACDSIFS